MHTEEFISLKNENCMIEKISVWKNPPQHQGGSLIQETCGFAEESQV